MKGKKKAPDNEEVRDQRRSSRQQKECGELLGRKPKAEGVSEGDPKQSSLAAGKSWSWGFLTISGGIFIHAAMCPDSPNSVGTS
ncbi:hypothetical protein VNO80_17789 [Phaseolus coccineus]|uniref:Uncharacterized protein n=1 Tax=Phaseolus coccineus TaxID=3886 RepID=A0AAN9QYU2_PHACN